MRERIAAANASQDGDDWPMPVIRSARSREEASMGVDPRALADDDLMQLVRSGDARAFEVIYDRHAAAAFSLAYRIAGTRPAAEEVTQEAFLALWRSGARYDRTRGSVRTWILAIVHHRAVDALRRGAGHDRRRAELEGVEDRLEAPERTPAEAARNQEAVVVRAAMQSLPSDQSRVIQLAYFGGYTHTEIAELLQAPVGTVKGRMRLGLQKLRGELMHGEVAAP
jgi:RNA polymerase sigma-70 factor (ECF subfamily)